MTLRKAASPRSGARTHYFYEGRLVTLCGLAMTKFTVKPDDTPMSCIDCAAAIARAKREEQAS